MLVKTLWSYPMRAFPDSSVVGLLKNVKVSAIRGIPCRLRGRVIGRGVPGLIWSEDFVMQDDTGIMFLDYRQPWRIWEFLFGLLRRGEWAGREVEAEGWYRRAPVPYVELKRIASGGDTRRCYVFHVKLVFALILLVAPLLAIA
jgi:heat shock protein HtpX